MESTNRKARASLPEALSAAHREIERLREGTRLLEAREQSAFSYIREKVDQLLKVIGTWPLKPEELDDESLISLDPIGIVADAFVQVLEHLQDTNDDLVLARDEIHAIFDSAGAAILVVDRSFRLQSCNAQSRVFFVGDTPLVEQGDLPGLLDHGGSSDIADLLGEVCRDGKSVEKSDFSFGDFHFHVVGTPVRDKAGKLSKVMLVFTDITERRGIEQSLREAESRLTTIVNSVQAGILVVDAETHIIRDVNDSAVSMIQETRENLIGSVCHDYVCRAERGQCPIEHCECRGDNSERRLLRPNGDSIPILKTVTSIELNGRTHYLESFIDLSERKLAEQALVESEQRYRSLYNTMREGVALHELILDADNRPVDYRILDVNPSYESILGLPRESVVGRKASDVYGTGEPPYLTQFARVANSGTPASFEADFEPMGRVFSVSVFSPAPLRFATVFDDISERKRVEKEVHRLAFFDTLTGLPNRTLLQDRLREALTISAREDYRVAVLFLDLDRFKTINDSMGHAVGDGMLKAIGNRLELCVRESDTVGRLGGDEFVVILPMIQHGLDAVRVAKTIMDRVAEPMEFDHREIYTSCSIGIALFPMDGTEAGTLISNADMAMYAAKERGRNNYQFFSAEMNRRATERLEMETRLRKALREQEIRVFYQPQLDVARGKVTGVEALVRWRDPEYGMIPPRRFIPLAEETGLILPLGEMVLFKACAQAKAWQAAGVPWLTVAVNLSGFQLKQGDIAETVHRVLAATGLAPSSLELELTESMLMDHAQATVGTLRKLKAMGLRLTIDDFGTGYSSLHYLKDFPIDRIKVAQEFVRDISADPGDAAIVDTIIAMTAGLGMEVVAEGVETVEQLRFLRSRGCQQMQGFYFAKPMSADTVAQYLRSGVFREGLCPVGIA